MCKIYLKPGLGLPTGAGILLREKMGGKNLFSAKVRGRSLFHLEKSGTTTFSKGKKGAIQDSVNYVTSGHSLTEL